MYIGSVESKTVGSAAYECSTYDNLAFNKQYVLYAGSVVVLMLGSQFILACSMVGQMINWYPFVETIFRYIRRNLMMKDEIQLFN